MHGNSRSTKNQIKWHSRITAIKRELDQVIKSARMPCFIYGEGFGWLNELGRWI